MTGNRTYRPKLPAEAPTASDLAERTEFAALVSASLPSVRASAAAWRNGLTAFLTLVTTGIVIKGRDTTADIPAGWRAAVTILIGGGLTLAVIGLWHALAAQAGSRARKLTLADIRRDHGTVAAYRVFLADQAADKLRNARIAVAIALALLLAGLIATWWAPAASAGPPAYLKVGYRHTQACGRLQAGGGGQLRLTIPGARNPAVIPLAQVTYIAVVSGCPPSPGMAHIPSPSNSRFMR